MMTFDRVGRAKFGGYVAAIDGLERS